MRSVLGIIGLLLVCCFGNLAAYDRYNWDYNPHVGHRKQSYTGAVGSEHLDWRLFAEISSPVTYDVDTIDEWDTSITLNAGVKWQGQPDDWGGRGEHGFSLSLTSQEYEGVLAGNQNTDLDYFFMVIALPPWLRLGNRFRHVKPQRNIWFRFS